MKELKSILRSLESMGFRVVDCHSSLKKIYPPDSTKPFYSLHYGEEAIHPLKRFARKNWGIDNILELA